MTKNWGIILGFISIAALCFFYAQGSFTRFEHKTLSCTSPLIGPFELVINKPRVGQNIQLTQPQRMSTIPISEIEGDVVVVKKGDLTLAIHFEDAQVHVQHRSQLRISQCETTVFTM